MKLIHDFIHTYKGFGIHLSKCRVQIWEDAAKNVVLFSDINKGTSVTNASEQIAQEIKPNLTRIAVRFFETYPHNDSEYDEISYTIRDGEYSSPDWKRMPYGEFKQLIGEGKEVSE